jgi:hypothetical protein
MMTSSTTNTDDQRPYPRPCFVWQTQPNIEVLLFSRFSEIDIEDANFDSDAFSKEYLRQRLIPIAPKQALDGHQSLTVKTTSKDSDKLISNCYLILIPVQVKDNRKLRKLLPQYFDRSDLLYITQRLLDIQLKEQLKEKQDEIEKVNQNFISNNDDDDDDNDNVIGNQSESSSFILIARPCRDLIINSNEKVSMWIKKCKLK